MDACPCHTNEPKELGALAEFNKKLEIWQAEPSSPSKTEDLITAFTQSIRSTEARMTERFRQWLRERMGHLDTPEFKTLHKSVAISFYDRAMVDAINYLDSLPLTTEEER